MATSSEAIGVLGVPAEEAVRPRRHWTQSAWRLARQNPLGTFGLLVIVFLVIVAVFAPVIAPYEVGDYTAGQPREGMSWEHPFGTDDIGRDMFSRVVYGTRISMEFSIVPFHDEDGRIIGMGAIMRDVTARFEELKALRKKLAATSSRG